LAIEALSILAERFPSAFILKGLWRPLKIGIDHDLAEGAPELSMPAIKQALRLYVGSASYQRALADGAEAPEGRLSWPACTIPSAASAPATTTRSTTWFWGHTLTGFLFHDGLLSLAPSGQR